MSPYRGWPRLAAEWRSAMQRGKRSNRLLRRIQYTLLGYLLATACCLGQDKPRITAGLVGGITIAFTTEFDPPGYPPPPGGVSVGEAVDRFLVDKNGGVYFGYGVEVERLPGSGKLRVLFKPISPRIDQEMRHRWGGPLRPQTLPRFPSPQVIDDGDTIALTLLVNPQTGAKMVDKLHISTGGSGSSPAPSASRDFRLEDVQFRFNGYRLLVNGEVVAGGENSLLGISGSILGLFRPGQGTYVLSVLPRTGYAFEKLGVVTDNRLSFSHAGDKYEWISSSPILGIGSWNLWVLFDAGKEPKGLMGRRSVTDPSPAPEYRIGAAGTVSAFLKQ